MIELTELQCKELLEQEPVAIDPKTHKEYVLVQRELFTRMRTVFDEDGLDMGAVSVLVDQAMRDEDKGDPTLAFYQ